MSKIDNDINSRRVIYRTPALILSPQKTCESEVLYSSSYCVKDDTEGSRKF